MFQITEDPSSESLVQCLVKNYKNGSIVSVDMDKVSVRCIWSAFIYNELNTHTTGQNMPSTVQGSVMTDPLWSETCWSTFKYSIILIVSTYYILCISWIIMCHYSEVCHPPCVFKLYGEVNSVKNTTINIWLNDGVYWHCKKTTCFGL